VQDEPAAGEAVRVPPDKLTVDGDPGGLLMVAVIVPLPQEPVTVVEANFKPPGKESVKEIPLSALPVFGLATVKLKVLLLFSGTLLGLNDLLMVGGATMRTVSLEAVPVNPPTSVEVGVTVLGAEPATVPVTLTVTVQEAPGANVAPDNEMVPEPAAAVGVVLQVLVRPFGVDTTRVPGAAEGSVSLNATPLRVVFALLLLRVKVSVVLPCNGMLCRVKALVIDGGLMTVMLAEAVLPVSPPASVAVTLPLVLF